MTDHFSPFLKLIVYTKVSRFTPLRFRVYRQYIAPSLENLACEDQLLGTCCMYKYFTVCDGILQLTFSNEKKRHDHMNWQNVVDVLSKTKSLSKYVKKNQR